MISKVIFFVIALLCIAIIYVVLEQLSTKEVKILSPLKNSTIRFLLSILITIIVILICTKIGYVLLQ